MALFNRVETMKDGYRVMVDRHIGLSASGLQVLDLLVVQCYDENGEHIPEMTKEQQRGPYDIVEFIKMELERWNDFDWDKPQPADGFEVPPIDPPALGNLFDEANKLRVSMN